MIQRLFLFLACFFTLPLLAETEMKVSRIEILPQNLPPDYSFNANAILATLQTKVGNRFSQTEFDSDLKNLSKEYDRIEPIVTKRDDSLFISLKLWLKPKIRSIQFQGNCKVDTSTLEGEIEIKKGETFERDKFVAGFNKVKTLYLKKGYFEAELSYNLQETLNGEIDIFVCINEGKAGYILKVLFEGLDPCEEDDIYDLMLTKKYFFFLSWYNGRGIYHPEMIEHDKTIILNYLQNKGYADATVEIKTRETSARNRVVLMVCVDKGPYYSIGNVTFTGNTIFCNDTIIPLVQLGPGSPYSPECIRNTISSIRDKYGNCGYIDASVDVELNLHEDSPCYDIALTIDEGRQYHVGMIHVFGNRCTETRVILNESLLCPGDVFDTRKIQGTERRICNTGFFKRTNVYAVKNSRDDDDYRDVFIEVEEQDTGNVGLFCGFNSLQNIFGGVELTERNFNAFGLPQVLNKGPCALRGAGEYFHVKADLGKRQTAYILQWTVPYVLDKPWILGFDLEKNNNRMVSRGYEIKTYGGDVHATYLQNDYLKYDYYYRARHTDVSNSHHHQPVLDREAELTGFISAVGATMIYDSSDSPRRPTNGFRSRLMYEIAGLGGNFDFMKFGYANTYYYPLTKHGVLKFRGDINFTHAYGQTDTLGIPLSERYFLGGDCTVRGYKPFIIGPKYRGNQPRGGVSSYLLSEEYQHSLLDCPCIDGFIFVDAGYVSLSEFTVGRPAASVGFGIRAELMRNLPATIGVGFPIHPYEKHKRPDGSTFYINNAQRFFFSFGGQF